MLERKYPICSTNAWVIFSIDIQQASSLISNLQEQEAILKQCIEQLESVDAARITLINHLKEALSEQVLSTFSIILQMFSFECILSSLPTKLYILFCLFVTGNTVRASPQSVASKLYSHTFLRVIDLSSFFIVSYLMISWSSIVNHIQGH